MNKLFKKDMILTIKHKFIIYRRFETDIWGYCYTNLRCRFFKALENKRSLKELYKLRSPILQFFYKLYREKAKQTYFKHKRLIYKFHGPIFERKKKKFNLRFVSIRLTRLYFLTFQDYQFRKLFRRAIKLDGNFEINYLRFLECRLLAIIYKLNYTNNIFWLLRFIKQKNNIFIDFKPINKINSIVPVGKLITITNKWRLAFDYRLLKRLNKKLLYFNRPNFLFISYKCHFAYLMRFPRKKDIIYPFALDVQRITGYY